MQPSRPTSQVPAMPAPFMGLASLGVTPRHHGKVREILDLGEELLIVATDRLSAFDHVLPTGIPERGILLTRIATFWFRGLVDFVPTHFVSDAADALPPDLAPHQAALTGRVMRVRKAERVPVECVVRGWLTGSGYQSYQANGTVCGIPLPKGLGNFERIPEPIFTPTTKADQGHDEPLTFEELADHIGGDLATELRRLSLMIFARGAAYAEKRGIVIADTKFEFGWIDGRLALIDEVLTPDSSRFWPSDSVGQGRAPHSLDKQFVRDYLLASSWDRVSTPPPLPAEVVARTRERYREAAERLMGGRTRPDWTA
jgi:phosphoribosylaminoimidazole-succinocarboxamide synthase